MARTSLSMKPTEAAALASSRLARYLLLASGLVYLLHSLENPPLSFKLPLLTILLPQQIQGKRRSRGVVETNAPLGEGMVFAKGRCSQGQQYLMCHLRYQEVLGMFCEQLELRLHHVIHAFWTKEKSDIYICTHALVIITVDTMVSTMVIHTYIRISRMIN